MSRKAEDELLDDLKHPKKENANQIDKLIDKTIRSNNKVYLTTDWHLWLREEKNKPTCHKRSNFNEIINKINNTVKPDDLLINLGDLVDGEFTLKKQLKETIQTINCNNMILVLGNNDLFDKDFYKECGFKYVVQSFTWKNILFTHIPIKNDNHMNIHGHIHGYKTYWVPYTNQIDVAALNGRSEPVELKKVMDSQKSYSKTIKECPEHFNEGYIVTSNNVFDNVMTNNYIKDPYI